MSNYEILTVVISAIALIVSIVSFFWNKAEAKKVNDVAERANSYASQANSVALGNIELAMKQMITSAKERLADLSIQYQMYLLKENKNQNEEELLRRNFRAAMENTLNAYEEACAKYLDGKVDRKRYKQLYRTEIRQIVCDPNHKEFFDAVTSPYKAILKVYDEWENLEK